MYIFIVSQNVNKVNLFTNNLKFINNCFEIDIDNNISLFHTNNAVSKTNEIRSVMILVFFHFKNIKKHLTNFYLYDIMHLAIKKIANLLFF